MALTCADFDDDCEIPVAPNDWREISIGAVLCAAIGIALAYLSLAPVWLIIAISSFSLPFILKQVSEVPTKE